MNMSQKLFEIIIAFLVGLIPFIIKILFDNRQYRISQVDKLSISFFEKQLNAFLAIHKNIIECHATLQSVLASFVFNDDIKASYDSYVDSMKKIEGFALPLSRLSTSKEEYIKLIRNNELIIPNEFLKNLTKYEDLLDNLFFTIALDFKDVPNKEIKIYKTKDDILKFQKEIEETYVQIISSMRTYVGTEHLSISNWKYVKNKSTLGTIYHKYNKTNLDY